MNEMLALHLLHKRLKDRSSWYLDPYCPDSPELQVLVEKAKWYAAKRLSKMCFLSFWWRYNKWRRSAPIIGSGDEYFNVFLSDMAFDLGLKALSAEGRDQYSDFCHFNIYFIK